ncbi:MAG: putative selenate reductase subunit YgfK [Ignavibacteria bacterium]|nr:putative selenate reductase subunit YgfK [Ignavibacteria bacterium]
MSDHMHPFGFTKLIQWIDEEAINHKTVFGIPVSQIYRPAKKHSYSLFGESLDNIMGPAAGPHTQMANNIITAYLTGGRFIELKTVQILDELVLDKPCIDARDEGYNVEWSQELKLEQAFDEYLKAWLLLHVIGAMVSGSTNESRGFIFNMSVGYNLEGIKSERVNNFIEQLKNAALSSNFEKYKAELKNALQNGRLKNLAAQLGTSFPADNFARMIDEVSPVISRSITLSTMHGCPADEIESIAMYLMQEKKIHTFVKMNPTLMGFDFVKNTLHNHGFMAGLDPHAFEKDISYTMAVPMIKRLQAAGLEAGVSFGVKLSNTLGVTNNGEVLAGTEQYLSGRALYPITINLAAKISKEFAGNIRMSYSGGITIHNVADVVATGIAPVTMATDLLKPGGYLRLAEIAKKAEQVPASDSLHVENIGSLAQAALTDKLYAKEAKEVETIKVPLSLPLTDCYMAPCTAACPVHQDVPDYIHLVKEGRHVEALQVIMDKNALPHITGYICDHQCMFHCTRQDYDEPVMIRDIKKAAAEAGYDVLLQKIAGTVKPAENAQKVAIIGAGPSGLAAAYYLAVNGFKVTVFEKEQNAGGIVRNVIPQFRIPQEVIEKDINLIEQLGVTFMFGVAPQFSVTELQKAGYAYVYLAIGAGIPNEFELEECNGKVLDAIPFLTGYNNGVDSQLGKNVAVIGGGNSAMDGARAAKRTQGVENVYIVYRRTKEQMPADKEEYDEALHDGVEFKELVLPVSFVDGKLKCQKMQLTEKGADGRRNVVPLEGEFVTFDVDTVITAIGERVEHELLSQNELGLTSRKKPVLSDGKTETSKENVFIGGDALRGPSTIIASAADGRTTAVAICKKAGIEFKTLLEKYPEFDTKARVDAVTAIKSHIVPHSTDIAVESSRCLSCHIVCNKCVDVCPNRANMVLPVSGAFKNISQVIHIDDLCNECGNCETFCPYNGKPYKQKITIFNSIAAMNDSTNEGFFIDRAANTVTARTNGKIVEANLNEITAEDNALHAVILQCLATTSFAL